MEKHKAASPARVHTPQERKGKKPSGAWVEMACARVTENGKAMGTICEADAISTDQTESWRQTSLPLSSPPEGTTRRKMSM